MSPLLFAAACAALGAVSEAPAVYAVVVANNGSFDGKRQPLRFADDDGARYTELFGLISDRVRLLTVLDADSQRVYGDLVGEAQPPRRAALRQALDESFAAMRDDIAAGKKVVFYFVYSGHGDIDPRGEGYVHLLDGPLTKSELFQQVIAASPATVNHVIIDACHAYFLVAGRGGQQAVPAGDFGDMVRSLVAKETLEAHPNTGVVLSTASAAEVHEWGRIEAGVFSHELRSALAGAADADGNGSVDYHEVAAFLAAANGALPDAKARIHAYARAPAQDLAEPMLRLPEHALRLRLPPAWLGRYWLEDDRGVRVADLNKADRYSVTLHLVPRPRYYLRQEGAEWPIDAASGGLLEISSLEARPLVLASRGAAHDLFDRYLFAIPFGPEFLAGFGQAVEQIPDPMGVQVELEPERPLAPWRYGAAALGAGLAVGATVFELLARSTAAEYRSAAGATDDVGALRARAESQHSTAQVMGGLAIGSAAVAVGLYLYDQLAP